ncbi:protealysin inhibitor emfourin [uncultured Microbacterium sp.]|uniref:protealysin inhibitor emfourin n=1 Tax=uncultured Microbacterium sp. TaxID=191216 RepID=UPI0035CC6FAE
MTARGPHAGDADAAASPAHVTVTVTRTGGFAGLRREWSAAPPADQTLQWIALIRSCPWEAVAVALAGEPRGADRFVWRIRAQCGPDELAADLADDDVSGPWLDLVDVVRGTASKS